ncbi:uncharacterized protein G2W53_027720 [Senna tora]|uniref:Uncharacterized protein n=1 Tax=Senna tora TaxID=362788 RepID=A0A834TJS8_9FABA|nr:uncharacterized protein G2W53_027720 [Senna tora]
MATTCFSKKGRVMKAVAFSEKMRRNIDRGRRRKALSKE